MTAPCAPWCASDHEGQAADERVCEGLVFETDALTAPRGLWVGIRQGETGKAVVYVDEVHTSGAAFTPVLELTGEQIVMMRDALMELSCRAGVCDCGHGPLCRHPDCIGDCENSPKCQGLKATA